MTREYFMFMFLRIRHVCLLYCDLFLFLAAPAGSSEKKTRRKMRRERRKLMKKELKSADPSDNLMSELPFSLTSPSSWDDLGCVYILNIIFYYFFELQLFHNLLYKVKDGRSDLLTQSFASAHRIWTRLL